MSETFADDILEAAGALTFMWVATGVAGRDPTPEQLEWARSGIEARKALGGTNVG